MSVDDEALGRGAEPSNNAAMGGLLAYLHIGTMKTGTSFLQANLDHARRGLADLGVLYPGNVGSAVHDVLDRQGARTFGDSTGAWDELAAQVRAWRGHKAIISMEFLTLATPERATRIVDSLRPADVHVIVTVRDLARTIRSAWQQTTKNRQVDTWPGFLEDVMRDQVDASKRVAQNFWQHHDLPRIVSTWSGVVGADHVHLVTVPPSGADPNVLWERFCATVGIDGSTFASDAARRPNSSLGFAEAEMMRRLNIELGRSIDAPSYRTLVTGFLSRQVLRRAAEPTPPPTLPRQVHDWARRRSGEVVAQLQKANVDVVGDLDDLVPPPYGDDGQVGPPASAPEEAEVTAVAIRAVAALVTKLAGTEDSSGLATGAGRRREGRGGGRVRKQDRGEPRRSPRGQRRNFASSGTNVTSDTDAAAAETSDFPAEPS